MTIHDISATISAGLVTWANSEVGIAREWLCRVDEDDAICTVSRVTIGSHCGTHVDAPLHFLAGGATVESLDLNDLVGACEVIELPGIDHADIEASDLIAAGIAADTTRLLIKTSNSRRGLLRDPHFHEDFVAISPEAARWLVARGVRTVGVDYLSVGAAVGEAGPETHRILLGAGVVLLEGLLLEDVAPGRYQLAALPLKIAGAEGSPMRAVLIEP